MHSRLDSLEERMDSLEERLNGRMDNMEESLNSRMDGIEERMDRQFAEVKEELKVHRSVLNVILDWTDRVTAVDPKLPRIGSQSMYGN